MFFCSITFIRIVRALYSFQRKLWTYKFSCLIRSSIQQFFTRYCLSFQVKPLSGTVRSVMMWLQVFIMEYGPAKDVRLFSREVFKVRKISTCIPKLLYKPLRMIECFKFFNIHDKWYTWNEVKKHGHLCIYSLSY